MCYQTGSQCLTPNKCKVTQSYFRIWMIRHTAARRAQTKQSNQIASRPEYKVKQQSSHAVMKAWTRSAGCQRMCKSTEIPQLIITIMIHEYGNTDVV